MTTIRRMLLALILATFGTSSAIRAHDGGHDTDSEPARSWTLPDGSQLHGTLISADSDFAKILTADGRTETVELAMQSGSTRLWIARKRIEIEELNRSPKIKLVMQVGNRETEQAPRPAIADAFAPFEKTVKVRWDRDYLFVESNGIPEHRMMVGITSWQQQVPLPQSYVGDNAWRIPLHPVPAKNPVTTKGKFLRGAIALAVNGIPIFNPLNNRGDDAFLFGELDEFGGHCGRADDYHYHIAPVHLEKAVGKGKPIAFALDGYPILGYQEADSPDYSALDWMNGHKDKEGHYHYHATEKYPYLNGGFYGQVVEREGQVDPQPRAEPVRPSLPPMQGAKITQFEKSGKSSLLTYDVKGKTGTVRFTETENGAIEFVFTDPSGKSKTESYRRRNGPGGPGRGRPQPPPPREEERRDPPPEKRPQQNNPQPDNTERPRRDISENTGGSSSTKGAGLLVLSSSSVNDKGMLSIDCTCDGKRQSPAIAWKKVPEGTKSWAISLWHTAPDQEKSYWLVYNIPADSTGLAQNARTSGTQGIGVLGRNDKRRLEFDPMCSKGPGVKTYHITVYALSQTLDVKPDQMDRKRLLEEFKKVGLGQETFDFQFERK